jgi:hypothetical protein
MTIVGFILLIAFAGIFIYTARTWKTVNDPVIKPNPYSTHYQASDYPAKTFMSKVLSTPPDGVTASDWKVSEDHKADTEANILPESCDAPTQPKSLLSSKSASGGGIKIVIAVFGSGQARSQYQSYAKALADCQTVQSDDTSSSYNAGLLMTKGDAIISLQNTSTTPLATIQSWLQRRVDDSLTATSCVSTDESIDDAKRSFYYDQSSYSGTFTQEVVTVNDPMIVISSPQSLSNTNMNIEATFVDPSSSKTVVPESPLPAGMASSIPSAPGRPAVTSMPVKPSNQQTVTYQIADTKGPGCGWYWSGQQAPVFSKDVISKNKKTIITAARKELRSNIASYNQRAASWSTVTSLSFNTRTSWDSYTNQVNAVYASWNDLRSKRASVRSAWYQYVEDYTTWSQWDQKKADAQTQWDKDVSSCVAKAKQDYDQAKQQSAEASASASASASPSPSPSDSDSPSPSPSDSSSTASPSPSTTPSETPEEKAADDAAYAKMQTDCSSSVAKPSILTATKPGNPVRPAIPSGMTMPASWPTVNDGQ